MSTGWKRDEDAKAWRGVRRVSAGYVDRYLDEQRYGAPSSALPARVKLRDFATIMDQPGNSCTGHGLSQVMAITERAVYAKAHPSATLAQVIAACPEPSPMAAYYNGRRKEGRGPVVFDRGAFPWLVAEAITAIGLCDRADWNVRGFAAHQKPSLDAFNAGYKRRGAKFYRINSSGSQRSLAVRSALAVGKAVGFGTRVAESIFSHTGPHIVDLPEYESSAGLHYMCISGYERSDRYGWLYDVVQSYGPTYRDSGHFQITEAYLAWRMTSDLIFIDDWKALHDAARP